MFRSHSSKEPIHKSSRLKVEMTRSAKNLIFQFWRSILVVAIPLLFLPVPILIPIQEARCGYVVLVMAFYWMTEALPLAITSLLPVVLLPLLGIMDTGKVCIAYMKETNVMFIGGLMMAIAIEHCNLHKRVALSVLLAVGSSPRWLMLGFMITSMFLSMWISNTAATALMVPIVQAVVEELYKDEPLDEEEDFVISQCPRSEKRLQKSGPVDFRTVQKAMLLSVAYSSNIGGTGTITGTAPNLAIKGIVRTLYPHQEDLNFATWMAFSVPVMIINVFIAWLWLQFLFLRNSSKMNDVRPDNHEQVKKTIRKKYEDLGSMQFKEIAVLALFIILVSLWFLRDPQFIKGWSSPWRQVGINVDDATSAILIATLLFIIPAELNLSCFGFGQEPGTRSTGQKLLNWKVCQEKIPWDIILLLGGGFALSDASKKSGLSDLLGQQLEGLGSLPLFAILIIVCIMTATVTEVASNTATANILLPVLAKLAELIAVNPLYLMVPATITCSFAFMLPVATPPNAIVFAAGKMKTIDMMKAGFFMNITCVIVLCVMVETLGVALFDIKAFPDWANTTRVDIGYNEVKCN